MFTCSHVEYPSLQVMAVKDTLNCVLLFAVGLRVHGREPETEPNHVRRLYWTLCEIFNTVCCLTDPAHPVPSSFRPKAQCLQGLPYYPMKYKYTMLNLSLMLYSLDYRKEEYTCTCTVYHQLYMYTGITCIIGLYQWRSSLYQEYSSHYHVLRYWIGQGSSLIDWTGIGIEGDTLPYECQLDLLRWVWFRRG